MSTPTESIKLSTTAVDNVDKEQHDVPKSGTVEQDTAVDDTLLKSLDAKITSEDHPVATSDGSEPAANVVPGADLPVLEVVALPQGAGNGEVWIPKGPPSKPNAPQTGPHQGPTRPPPKPKRDN